MRLTKAVAAALAASFILSSAYADTYPSKPITIVLPYAPGASTEQVARAIQPALEKSLGQPIIIENRPGGAGVVGSAYVARAKPDGYTLLISTNNVFSINPYLTRSFPFDPVSDLKMITTAVRTRMAIVVHKSVPVNSLQELIAFDKQSPGALSFGTSGTGTPMHVGGELLKQLTGMNMTHIPYKGGGTVINDLLGGHLKVAIVTLSSVIAHIEKGDIKLLAVGEPQRLPTLPNTPAIAEVVEGFTLYSLLVVMAPKGTPDNIIARLNTDIVKALRDPAVQSRLDALGLAVVADTPAEADRLMQSDIAFWKDKLPALKLQAAQ
jgi:tripartite-type tricarboxylate transporter receptor subunit TctC